MSKNQKLEFALQLLHVMLGNDAEEINALFQAQKDIFGKETPAIKNEAIALLPVKLGYGESSQEKEKLAQHQAFRDKVLSLVYKENVCEVDLEKNFSLPAMQQLPALQTCIERINQLIQEKHALSTDHKPFYVKIANGFVKIGYENNPQAESEGFHNHLFLEYDLKTNIACFQFVIFDGCREWDLFNEIKMYGAPEEGQNAGFTIPLKNMTFSYVIHTK